MTGWAPPAAGPSRSRLGTSDQIHQHENKGEDGPPRSLQPDFAPPKTPASAAVGPPGESNGGSSLTETTDIDINAEPAALSDAAEEIPEEEAVDNFDDEEDDEEEPDLDRDDHDYEPGAEGLRIQRGGALLGSRRSSRSDSAGQAQLGFAPPPPPPVRRTQDALDPFDDGSDAHSRAVIDDPSAYADLYDAFQDEHDSEPSIMSARNATMDRPYGCSFEGCSKAFSRRSDLVRHYRIHANSRPFECPVCHKSFIQRSALTVHERTHTGERPHHCEVCNRPFADSSSLARHRRTHTGERPYKCGLCSKEFCRKITLDKHYNKHHAPDRDQRLAAELERRRLAAAERERQKLLKLERLHEERRKRQNRFGEQLAREYRLPPPATRVADASKPPPSRYGPYAPGRSTRRWNGSNSSSLRSESAAQQAGPQAVATSSFPRYPPYSSGLETDDFIPAPPAGTFFTPANAQSNRVLLNSSHRPNALTNIEPPSRSRTPLYLTNEYGQRYEVDEFGNAISNETMHWEVPQTSSTHYVQSYDASHSAYPDSLHRSGTPAWQSAGGLGQSHAFAPFDGGSANTSDASQLAPPRSFFQRHLDSADVWVAPIRDPLPPDAASAYPVLPSIDPSLAQDSHFSANSGSDLLVATPTRNQVDVRRQPTLTREQLPDWLRSPRRPAAHSPGTDATYLPMLDAPATNGESPHPRNRHYGFTSQSSGAAHNPALCHSPENGSSRSWFDVEPLHASPPTSHLTSAGARYSQLEASPSALRLSRFPPS